MKLPRPRIRLRRLLIPFVTVAVISAVVVLLVLRRNGAEAATQPAAETLVAVERGDIRATVSAVGTVEFGVTADLGFGQSGRVAKLAVAVGDVVQKGATLAQLDTRDLVRSHEDAKSALRQADLKLAQARKGSDPTAIELAQLDVANAAAALRDLTSSPKTSDRTSAEASVASAETALARAASDLSKLKEGPTATEIVDAESAVTSAGASLARASSTLKTLRDGPTPTEAQAARDEVAAAQEALAQAEKALADGRNNPSAAIPDAEAQVRAAESEQQTLRKALSDLQSKPTAEAVAKAQDALERARLTWEDTVRTGNTASAAVKERALIEYREARRTYDEAVSPATTDELTQAQTNLGAAEARLSSARLKLADAKKAPDLAALQVSVDSAARRLGAANLKLAELQKQPKAEDIAREELNVAAAWQALRAARSRQSDLTNGSNKDDLAIAELAARSAESSLADARARRAALDEGPEALALQQAQSSLAAAKAKLKQLQEPPDPIDVELLELALGDAKRRVEAAQAALDDAKLIAPFAGVVTVMGVAEGEQTAASVVKLARLDSIRVKSNLDETDISQIKVNQAAVITLESLPDARYRGRVTLVSAQGESQQNLVTFPIWFEIQNADRRLLGGMTAEISIVVSEASGVLVIPPRAVRTVGRRAMVEVREADGTTTQRPVVTGVANDGMVEIKEGLREGEQVVVRNAVTQARTVNPFGGGGGLGGGAAPGGGRLGP